MARIPFDVMYSTIRDVFLKAGMSEARAETCARIHTETSCDGIPSHGLNRVARFVDYLHKGWVRPEASPSLKKSLGTIELWDGELGPGITNAFFCTDRAMELARAHGMGLVALSNTTHWMRGGTYGWHAAEKGYACISWTNTEPTMPVWGAQSLGVGNNPLVIALPRENGPLVLDMAMSLYSFGKIEVTRLAGEQLPYPGGYDEQGELTSDPGAIERSRRILPTGMWKGSSLSIVLDVLAALLSGGKAGYEMDAERDGSCTGCCQIYMVFDPAHLSGKAYAEEITNRMVHHIHASVPAQGVASVRYPGERVLRVREENLQKGIPADDRVWEQVKALA